MAIDAPTCGEASTQPQNFIVTELTPTKPRSA